MPFSKSVPLYHLIGLITRKVPARRLRLVCLVVFFAVVLSGLPVHPKHDGVNAQSSRPGLTQGPPSHNLPNPDETYANVASGRTLKGYGRSGPPPLTAQSVSVVTVYPTAHQTPNSPGQLSISASNTDGSGSLSITASSATASCTWYGFPNVPGQIVSVRLKMGWSASGSINGPMGGGGGFSLDAMGGGTSIGGSSFSQSSSVDVALSNTQDLTQVQVRMSLNGGAGPNTTFSGNASIWNIRIEVQVVNCFTNVPADRWKGEYFNNQALSGSPAMVSDDSIAGTDFLNRNFGGGSPSSVCGVIPDNFSARWTRTVNFAQGIYRFTAGVDNGVRLYVDGNLRIDWWGEFAPNTYRADVFLSAGAHEIKLEFIEYTGGASASLSWTAVEGASGNMAFGKPASQSSTYSTSTADLAVDGYTNGDYAANSLAITNLDHQPWWQVDLGSVRQIGAVILWNRTDVAGERLSNFYVLVSDNPFSSTDLTATINQAGVSSYYTADPVGPSKEIGVYRSGRYVRVQLAGDNYLHLAEVEVRGGASRSLAFGKSASQSSTAYGADASRAVDSNTSGNFYDYSVTHTNYEHQPWWQVDLGSVQQIGAVILWNRTDAASERLSNFYVLVSDAPFNSTDLTATINQAGVSNYYTAGPVGAAKEIGVYRSGRYVRVQLAGDNYLHLAEVEVRSGASGSGCVASVSTDRWKGEYFNNTTLMGSPAMVRDDGGSFLYFDFGSGAPSAACGPSPELFSARWTRTVNFGAGLYRFSVTGDDGVRLYVDEQLKIDAWVLQGPTTYTADVTLSAGPHVIRLEYFEYTGGATAFLFWRLVPVPNCLQSAPLIGAAPRTGAGESVTTTPASEAPKRCGQKSSD
jgi:NedA-like, galactose-binding domain/PA14 domain